MRLIIISIIGTLSFLNWGSTGHRALAEVASFYLTENAKKKITSKHLDAIVLNSLNDKGAGFATNTNKITIIDKNLNSEVYNLKSKDEVAQDILTYILQNRQA